MAIAEMERGLVDADLGAHLFKKRVALAGRGKRGGARTLLAFRHQDRAFFLYGFAKNARANISEQELKALKLLTRQLLSYSDEDLAKALTSNALFEVEHNE